MREQRNGEESGYERSKRERASRDELGRESTIFDRRLRGREVGQDNSEQRTGQSTVTSLILDLIEHACNILQHI
jgi:hypothetical protein